MFGYMPQSQSLLGESEGEYVPSARLLDNMEPQYSQSLVDTQNFFTADPNLKFSLTQPSYNIVPMEPNSIGPSSQQAMSSSRWVWGAIGVGGLILGITVIVAATRK